MTGPTRIQIEVENYLAGKTYAKQFFLGSLNPWNHASENYAIDVAKKAIDKADGDRRHFVDVPDIEDAIASYNMAVRVAALFTIGGVLAGVAATGSISAILAPHNKAFWWIIGASAVIAVIAVIPLIAGYRKSSPSRA